jgi:hypothetical protein
MDLCYQSQVVSTCSCYDIESFPFYDVQVCHTDEQNTCQSQVKQSMSSASTLNDKCFPLCPLECDSFQFSTILSVNQFPPTEHYLDLLRNENKVISKFSDISLISDQTLKNSVASVRIYYETLSYKKTEDKAQWHLIDLIANQGGILGLLIVILKFICEKIFQ